MRMEVPISEPYHETKYSASEQRAAILLANGSREPTPRQREILAYIKFYQEIYPQPSPTVREICEAVGLSSSSTVHHHLDVLERKGFLRRDRRTRSIELIAEASA